MHVIYNDDLSLESKPSVVTIGVFDGVHRGHSAIMQTVCTLAKERSARAVAVTFDGIPEEVLNPRTAPPRIMTLDQKLEQIASHGVELTLVLRLSRRLLDITAEDFVRDVLVGKLSALEVVVGSNFAFGKRRMGTVKTLQQMGSALGFGVNVVPPVVIDGTVVSSTEIRKLISAGNVEEAALMLGHPFVLRGKVAHGEGLGRQLGFPTANLEVPERQILPATGVYSAHVEIQNKKQPAVVSVGTRPTFGGQSLTVEVYIIGFSGDIYGWEIDVSFGHRLRGQIAFSNAKDLVAQIERDLEQVAAMSTGTPEGKTGNTPQHD